MTGLRYSEEVARRLGENVLLIRRRANFSQEELGALASLHRTEVGQLERGARLARIDTVIKLAGALKVAPGDLLKGMAWVPGRSSPGRFVLRGVAGTGLEAPAADG